MQHRKSVIPVSPARTDAALEGQSDLIAQSISGRELAQRLKRVELSEGQKLLDAYEHFLRTPQNHLLTRFSNSLVFASKNTTRNYNTDVWQFMVKKLLHCWDYPVKYNPLASGLTTIHALQHADQLLRTGEIDLTQARGLLVDAVRGTLQLIPAPATRVVAAENPRLEQLLGPQAVFEQCNGRMRMSLRGAPQDDTPVSIAKTDRQIISIIFGNFAPYFDHDFWRETLSRDSLGEVFNQMRRDGISENTLARKMASLGHLERFLESKGLLERPVLAGMKRPRLKPRNQTWLEYTEILKIYSTMERELTSGVRGNGANKTEREPLLVLRDRAMFAVLDITLIRCSALCNIRMQDLHLTGKNKYIAVREKGRTESNAPISGPALHMLMEYIDRRAEFMQRYRIPDEQQEFLFHTTRREQMCRRSVSRIIQEYADAAGVARGRNISAHVIRRTSATNLYERGMPIEDISALLNHKNIQTTTIYLRHAPGRKQNAIKAFHPMG